MRAISHRVRAAKAPAPNTRAAVAFSSSTALSTTIGAVTASAVPPHDLKCLRANLSVLFRSGSQAHYPTPWRAEQITSSDPLFSLQEGIRAAHPSRGKGSSAARNKSPLCRSRSFDVKLILFRDQLEPKVGELAMRLT